MVRKSKEYSFSPNELRNLKDKMLSWASRFSIFLCLDSNAYNDKYGRYEFVVAVGEKESLIANIPSDKTGSAAVSQDWLFGHLNYDYKNTIEPKLTSHHPGRIGFKDSSWFVPSVVCYIRPSSNTLVIEPVHEIPDEVYQEIRNTGLSSSPFILPKIQFTRQIDEEQYKRTVQALRAHIYEGDCYEINFCTEAYAENVSIDPLFVFRQLRSMSPAPFSAFYKTGDSYMMCASPERFIQKRGSRILSQPIKGTARRGKDAVDDNLQKQLLEQSEKERAENVMIVDLVRSDLSKSCQVGSIEVPDLFGIYSFPQVHQMISTISGELRNGIDWIDIIQNAFPMGSMTGAPKYRVMQLIDQYEASRRELFSGTVGYISPDGDFDFNVVIRSLFYNASTKYLAYQTGGAITWDSTPEGEWEEMRLKGEAMERLFGQ